MSTVLNNATGGAPYSASARTLGLASGAALAIALLILILFVLPAERGIDVTGIGARLGLAQMRDRESASPGAAAPATAALASLAAQVVGPQTQASISKSAVWRSDQMTVVLKPHTGLEVKALMKTGDHLIFHWESTGPVKMDMHGERPNDGDRFTRYWLEPAVTTAQGAFTAPFDGRHGWYWRNRGDGDVTITIKTSGFYENLIQPK